MSKVVSQELCIQMEDGAGARYMNHYDILPPVVRARLQRSNINICVACLERAVLIKNGFKFEEKNPANYLICIEEFERTYAASK